jgi:hypothetical protein
MKFILFYLFSLALVSLVFSNPTHLQNHHREKRQLAPVELPPFQASYAIASGTGAIRRNIILTLTN